MSGRHLDGHLYVTRLTTFFPPQRLAQLVGILLVPDIPEVDDFWKQVDLAIIQAVDRFQQVNHVSTQLLSHQLLGGNTARYGMIVGCPLITLVPMSRSDHPQPFRRHG